MFKHSSNSLSGERCWPDGGPSSACLTFIVMGRGWLFFSSHFLSLHFAGVCCLAFQFLAGSSLFPEILFLDVSTSTSLLRPSTFRGFNIICIEDPNLYLQLTSLNSEFSDCFFDALLWHLISTSILTNVSQTVPGFVRALLLVLLRRATPKPLPNCRYRFPKLEDYQGGTLFTS